MAVPKLTPEQWAEIKRAWQADPRDGYTWLVRELALPVSAPAVRKMALKQGWQKAGGDKGRKPAKPKPETSETRETKSRNQRNQRNQNQKPAKPTAVPKTSKRKGSSGDFPPVNDDDSWYGDPASESHVDEYGGAQRGEEVRATRARERSSVALKDPAMHDFYYGGMIDVMDIPPAGRATYRPAFAVMAYRSALLGSTMEQLAESIGVNESTIYRWQSDYPEFAEALRAGRQSANANVASRLYQRAMGYSYEAEEIKVVDGEVVRVPVVKHVPPCPQSIKFYLINREPELWKERVELVEKPTIALVDKEAMDQLYGRVLEEAAERRQQLQSRDQRLGLLLDGEQGAASRIDEEIITFDEEGD